MAEKPISTPLPADQPTNWEEGDEITPDGLSAGLTEAYGYNHMNKNINLAHEAINILNDAIEQSVKAADDDTALAASQNDPQNIYYVVDV